MGDSKRLAITTSWDDGHPLDLRVAELLAKYGLRGTFYVPLENCLPVLSSSQVYCLSSSFEIGAHTTHHKDLTRLRDDHARDEIVDSKKSIENITGSICKVFCFPRGRFRREHVAMVADAGFIAARTVEMMSLDRPIRHEGISLIPTTIQAHSHTSATYFRNALKRIRLRAIRNVLAFSRGNNWVDTALAMLKSAQANGHVFHLWGHSWEIGENCEWQNLERVFAAMERCRYEAVFSTNSELCR